MANAEWITAERAAAMPVLLRTVVGSEVHGTSLPGLGDIDHVAIAIEPQENVLGISESPGTWQMRSAWSRMKSDAFSPASQAGELDLTIHPARKWARIALDGNPNAVLPLFVDDCYVVEANAHGLELRANRHRFVSKELVLRHLGYMKAQRSLLVSGKGSRQELVAKHGFDTKHAAHMLRVGHQGLSILMNGNPEIPLQPALAQRIVGIRQGEVHSDEVISESHLLEQAIADAMVSSEIPDRADEAWVGDWLVRAARNLGTLSPPQPPNHQNHQNHQNQGRS